MFSFGTAAHVVPNDAQPAISVVSASATSEVSEIILKNDGTRYLGLSEVSWSASAASGESVTFSGDAIQAFADRATLLPGGQATVRIPFAETGGAPVDSLAPAAPR